MAELQGAPGELRFTIEVKRKATGKTEKYGLVGKVSDDGGVTKSRKDGGVA